MSLPVEFHFVSLQFNFLQGVLISISHMNLEKVHSEIQIFARSGLHVHGNRSTSSRFGTLTELEHVVPAAAEGVPGFGKQPVEPLRHSHSDERHDKHGVDGLDEALRLHRNHRVETADPGLKQHRRDPWRRSRRQEISHFGFCRL